MPLCHKLQKYITSLLSFLLPFCCLLVKDNLIHKVQMCFFRFKIIPHASSFHSFKLISLFNHINKNLRPSPQCLPLCSTAWQSSQKRRWQKDGRSPGALQLCGSGSLWWGRGGLQTSHWCLLYCGDDSERETLTQQNRGRHRWWISY